MEKQIIPKCIAYDEKYCPLNCKYDWPKCHKCGQYLDSPGDEFDKINAHIISSVSMNCDDYECHDYNELQLCPKCYEKVKRFIKNGN